jgi:hypothetical protein
MTMSEDTRTLQQLAEEVFQVQNACNLSGVALGMHRAVCRLRSLVTGDVHKHPICVLWSDKIASLTGTQFADFDYISKAYDAIDEMRKGVTNVEG